MGRFDDLVGTTPQGVGRFDDITTTGGRFDDLIEQTGETSKESPGLFSRALSGIGGAIGTIGRALSVGQSAVTGVAEKTLEKTGVLKDTGIKGTGALEGIKKNKSNVSVLQRVVDENNVPGLSYTPTTSVFGNFIHELPTAAFGVGADVLLDPLNLISKTGKIPELAKEVGTKIKSTYQSTADTVPAVQKVGDMLGRAFINRYGQSDEFIKADRSRKIAESTIGSDVKKITSSIIEKPAFIQQRVAQVIKGSITNDNEIKILAEPIREELDRVGGSLSSLNKKLLSEETFTSNKGTYFPRMYTAYEFPEDEVIKQAFSQRAVTTPRDRFKARLSDIDFARTINPTLADTESEIIKINERVADLVTRRKDVVTEITKEIGKLEKNGLRQSLKNKAEESFKELSAILEHRTGSFFRKAKGKTVTGKQIFTQVGVDDYEYYQPTLEGRKLKENIERLIYSPDGEIERIKKIIGRKDKKISDLLDEVSQIRARYKMKADMLPNMSEIKILAEQARKNLGEIKEAGFPAAKGLTQLKIAEERQKFFKSVSKLASAELKPGWIQLSDDKTLGDLAGKFLPPAEYKVIAEMRRVPTQLEKLYSDALRVWKSFKTAYNFSTLSRNDLTNFFVLNPLGGVGPHRLDIYAKTANEMFTNGHLYQLAKREGLEISTQEAAELVKVAGQYYNKNKSTISKFFDNVGAFHKMITGFYGSQDKFFKLANFIKGVTEDGMTPYEAMRRAQFYLVDYSEVPEFVAWARKSPIGIPFISFTYGVSKPLAKTLLEHPERLSAYYKILRDIQLMRLDPNMKEQKEREGGVLPEWISNGTYLRLPVTDKYNRGQYIDLQYILPFNIIEQKKLRPSNPVFTTLAAYLTNEDLFTGKEIVSKTDSNTEAAQKYATYIAGSLLPSFTPFVGTSAQKFVASIKQRPDKTGIVKDQWQVLLDILGGIKAQPIDPTIEAQKRAYEKQKEIDEVRSQLRRIMTDKTLFQEERDTQAEEVRGKLETLVR